MQADWAMLRLGYYLAYHWVSNLCVCPQVLQWKRESYLAERMVLFGFSRGGLPRKSTGSDGGPCSGGDPGWKSRIRRCLLKKTVRCFSSGSGRQEAFWKPTPSRLRVSPSQSGGSFPRCCISPPVCRIGTASGYDGQGSRTGPSAQLP